MFDKVIETKNKKISIQINNMGEVILKKPKNYNGKLLQEFVESKKDWIIEHKTKILTEIEKNSSIINYTEIFILGEKKELILNATENKIEGNKVYAKTNRSLITLLKKETLNFMKSRLVELKKRVGVEPRGFDVENTKRRWGVCSSKHIIKINLRAIMVSKECFDYILIHELSHIKEFNHSKKFWNIVKKNCPKYTLYKKELKQKAFLLDLYR